MPSACAAQAVPLAQRSGRTPPGEDLERFEPHELGQKPRTRSAITRYKNSELFLIDTGAGAQNFAKISRLVANASIGP